MSDNERMTLTPEEIQVIQDRRAQKATETAEQAAFKAGTAVDINELDRRDLTKADLERIGAEILRVMTQGR